ncbi:MAG: FprA family A-type flavoprotein, partial [Anaerovoracaceae bacterium]
MHNTRSVTENLYWVGANDSRLSLFENIHPLTNGVSYNSYLLLDKKTVLLDTVDWAVSRQFIENIDHVLDGQDLDYIILNHVEPDHGASLEEVLVKYPNVKLIATAKGFTMIRQFGFNIDNFELITVKDGDSISFGDHTMSFYTAPMVHWPEAMVTFDQTNGTLFSADAFGTFGALDGKLFNDEVNFERDWIDEARRYYTNI